MKPKGFSLVAKMVKCTWHPFVWAWLSICRQPEAAALRQRQEALNPVRWDWGSAFGWIKFPLTWFQGLLRCTKRGRVPRDTFPFLFFSLSPQLLLQAGPLQEMFYSSGPFGQMLFQAVTSQQQRQIKSCNKSGLELLPNNKISTSLWNCVYILTHHVVCLQLPPARHTQRCGCVMVFYPDRQRVLSLGLEMTGSAGKYWTTPA